MNEPYFTRKIHKLVQEIRPDIYIWKISDRYHSGIPDAWYCSAQSNLWVEYKFTQQLPQRFKPRLRPAQAHWLNARLAQNQQVAVIVGDPSKAIVLTDGAWQDSRQVTQTLTHRELAQWVCNQL